MTIHFVCTSNVFRSRLAQAYLASKNIPDLNVYSSGLDAKEDLCGVICWVAQWLIELYHLIPYASKAWNQTTKEMLKKADLIVFMNNGNFISAEKRYPLNNKAYLIWDIPDLDDLQNDNENEIIQKVRESKRIYSQITQNVDDLIKSKLL